MTTKFRSTIGYLAAVQRVEVERETESSVWINGRRRNKSSDWESFHDTFEEAKARIVNAAKFQVEQAQIQLDGARRHLEQVEAIQPC